MPNYEYPDPGFDLSVNDGVWKDTQRKDAAPALGGRAQAWMLDQEIGDALKFAEKAPSDKRRRSLGVEVQGLGDVLFCAGVKRIRHRASLERRRAIASWPGTSDADPDWSSASLRSASRSHASSTSGSESRLATRRSSSRERSAGASFRTSASRASRLVLTLVSGGSNSQTVACHSTAASERRALIPANRSADPPHSSRGSACRWSRGTCARTPRRRRRRRPRSSRRAFPGP